MPTKVSKDQLRSEFARSMSEMYKLEVPAYGALCDIVAEANSGVLGSDPGLAERLEASDGLDRINDERHGAIRLGSLEELAGISRVFQTMGMYPVGYYDLSVAGLPVHSTAFRPVDPRALSVNPFRMFTSVLRPELIEDPALRTQVDEIVGGRNIFGAEVMALVAVAEENGGLADSEATEFTEAVTKMFSWRDSALVSIQLYEQLHEAHRLVADIVSFEGPHINHLTPRTLDIDSVQHMMGQRGIVAKEVIEGPPRRQCPILLRQTSFKALTEKVNFVDSAGGSVLGHHTARFGEIEQRGVALTPKGRELYDKLLDAAGSPASPEYFDNLESAFRLFPDTWGELREGGFGYFTYHKVDRSTKLTAETSLDELVVSGEVEALPIVYEDFLPVSAAGIFRSNLGDQVSDVYGLSGERSGFETALGVPVLDPFEWYEEAQRRSITSLTLD